MHLSEDLTFELRTKEEKDPLIWDNSSYFPGRENTNGEHRITKEASMGGTKSEDL